MKNFIIILLAWCFMLSVLLAFHLASEEHHASQLEKQVSDLQSRTDTIYILIK